jgi:hypothetical protein
MTQLNLDDFRKPIIDEKDENFNYDDGLNINYNRIPLFYKDTPFTGSTISQEDHTCRVIEYVNGLMEGRNCFFSENILLSEIFYDYGYETHGKSWYENGNQESVWERYTSKIWDKNGSLFYEKYVEPDTEASEELFYFVDGTVKFKKIVNSQVAVSEYYTPTQESIFVHKQYFHTSPISEEISYNHDVLEKWYFNILDYENQSLDIEHFPNEVNARIHLIWMWFWEIFDKDKNLFISILYKLLQHPQNSVVERCISIIAYQKFLEPVQNFHSQFSNRDFDFSTIVSRVQEQQKALDKRDPNRKTKTF